MHWENTCWLRVSAKLDGLSGDKRKVGSCFTGLFPFFHLRFVTNIQVQCIILMGRWPVLGERGNTH